MKVFRNRVHGTLEKDAVESATKRVVFCNIMWAERYDDIDEKGFNGGAYVKKHKTGNESENFLPMISENDGQKKAKMFGSYETKCTSGNKQNQTHIEKIIGCDAMREAPYVDGVTVIWCATPPDDECRVVGWYQNARVYREYQEEPRWYNVSCDADDAVLLPLKERFDGKWRIPRRRRDPVGFGQANIWYAKEPEAQEFVQRILGCIDDYQQNRKNMA